MATFTFDKDNTAFQLAAALVTQTHRSVFLTGKAGTGKTTFLRYIREHCAKQMAIVAPTGVAAINAGGVTIHSFFQLPLAPFIPDKAAFNPAVTAGTAYNRDSLLSRLRLNAEKRKMLQQLELLVIDEISMVRCDILDAVDTILRSVRKKPAEKFGGVQLLLIGDLYQLSPVAKETDWQLLSPHYQSPFFFDSLVIRESPPLCIAFEKIYRQDDEVFIRVLNQVRNNAMDEEGFRILETRLRLQLSRQETEGYIILTTHNEQARLTNLSRLEEIQAPLFRYEAIRENDFPENVQPADNQLELKTGAQVMFIRNDSTEKGKRFFNGKIGWVTALQEDTITVRCEEEEEEIVVEREKWENIRYTLDPKSQTMEEEVLGSFIQFPLRLAWAITIHKSQGLTFEKAIIDAGEAFAPGQVYVALSRCISLEGLILKSRIRKNSLFTDPRVVDFSRQISAPEELESALAEARKAYLEKLLTDLFGFEELVKSTALLQQEIKENKKSLPEAAGKWGDKLVQLMQSQQETSRKFQQWIRMQFNTPDPPEQNSSLADRIPRAAAHYVTETGQLLSLLKDPPLVTESHPLAAGLQELLMEIFEALSLKQQQLTGLNKLPSPEEIHNRRKQFNRPAYYPVLYARGKSIQSDSPYPVLHQSLKKRRDHISLLKGLPLYLVASAHTLDEMSRYLPQTEEELLQISGMGKAKVDKFGDEFLGIIRAYCEEEGLGSRMHDKLPKRERKPSKNPIKPKGSSQEESFQLFKQGKDIASIAAERKLAVSTIEGHLIPYVEKGAIPLRDLLTEDKILRIEKVLVMTGTVNVTAVKQALGDSVSYTEIRWVMAASKKPSGISADQG
ncbi:MAG: helix-turn-helix domain-containing protein [Chitinophagaceae bacterium]|nr:helix-turn-helix domain-containing protein [Chitinophagaceae bacterium]